MKGLKHSHKIVIGIFLCLASSCVGQVQNSRKLNVVIVAVNSFDNSPWSGNALLEQAIDARATELKNFFETNFPGANVKRLDSSDISYSKLGSFFKGSFPVMASGNVTLLFILSHGEARQFDNPEAGSDLLIVAKDSDNTDKDHLLGSTLSLSTDILGHLNGLSRGSIIFGFIDTCHSGAASNFEVAVDNAIREKLGTKMMLMAATQSDQSTYSALFTKALLTMWGASGPPDVSGYNCTAPQPSVEKIENTIVSTLPTGFTVKAAEAFPSVLIDFPGRFCIEQFASDSALVLVDNSLSSTVVATFKASPGLSYPFPVKPLSVTPIGIPRQTYQLSFSDGNETLGDAPVDLKAQPFYLKILGTPTPSRLAKTFEKAATLAQDFGADIGEVKQYKLRAYAAYAAAGDVASVARLSSDLKISTIASDPTNVARLLPGISTSDRYTIAAATNTRIGNFSLAGDQFRVAAEQAKAGNDNSWEQLAQQSYLAYAAGGLSAKAHSVRTKLKLHTLEFCQACVTLEQDAAKSAGSALQFRDVSLKNLLTQRTSQDQVALQMLLGNNQVSPQ